MKGRPHRARCFRCAQKYAWQEQEGYDLRRTGRTQDRDGIIYREVLCRHCGHVGWTKHREAATLDLAEPAAPTPTESQGGPDAGE